jgi:hypothetical protein
MKFEVEEFDPYIFVIHLDGGGGPLRIHARWYDGSVTAKKKLELALSARLNKEMPFIEWLKKNDLDFLGAGAPTRKVWYYQLDPGRNLGKTNPLNDDDLAEFVELQKSSADSPKSWSVEAATIDPTTFDLSVKNPNGGEEVTHRSPETIMDEIAALDAESAEVLQTILGLL